jgi:hypothetical protein
MRGDPIMRDLLKKATNKNRLPLAKSKAKTTSQPSKAKVIPRAEAERTQAVAKAKTNPKPSGPRAAVPEKAGGSDDEEDDDDDNDDDDDDGEEHISNRSSAQGQQGTQALSGDEGPSRPTAGGKTPRKSPRPKIATVRPNYGPPKLPGNRPTVDPRHPNHRAMVLPLLAHEPVVFKDPNDDSVYLGYCAAEVTKPEDPVIVRRFNPDTNGFDRVAGLSIEDMDVVKCTDYLIYSGARYCVFGPPLNTYAGLNWGSAWLDLAGERAYFHAESKATDKVLYELRRLDVIMVRYPGVPDCPVLIVGFLQGQDESDWKAIGVMNCDLDASMSTEKTASESICYMSMTDVKKEYATTDSYIVEDVVEMSFTDHPTVKMYRKALHHITKWAKEQPRWLPPKTWKGRLNQLYPRQFKTMVVRGLEPPPCVRCQGLDKQLTKANVREYTVQPPPLPSFVCC